MSSSTIGAKRLDDSSRSRVQGLSPVKGRDEFASYFAKFGRSSSSGQSDVPQAETQDPLDVQ